MRDHATEMGEKIRAEDGVARAVEFTGNSLFP